MKSISHVITTIERGGAENQLLVVVRAQVESGKKVIIFPLKGRLDLYPEFTAIGAEVNLQLLAKNPFQQIQLLGRIISTENTHIHAHLPRAELVVSLINRKIEFVVSRHNAERFFPGKPAVISIILSRFVTKRAKAVIAISQAVKEFLFVSHEVSRKCLVDLVYYGYDEHFLKPNTSKPSLHRRTKRQKIIGTVGRLVPQKDYETLLTSFSNYSKFNNEAMLVILGEGYLETELKALALRIGISEKIVWVGKSKNVVGYLKEFDLLLLTSQYEGFGLILLEAMLAQIPIIASRNSAIPEVLGENHPGLCETGNSEDFGKRLIDFESSTRQLEVISAQNQRVGLFDPQLMRQKLESIYERK